MIRLNVMITHERHNVDRSFNDGDRLKDRVKEINGNFR